MRTKKYNSKLRLQQNSLKVYQCVIKIKYKYTKNSLGFKGFLEQMRF